MTRARRDVTGETQRLTSCFRMASPYASLAQRGLQCAHQAIAHDNAGDFQSARELYFEAAEIVTKMSEHELDDFTRDQYRAKATSYLNRMEELNRILGVKVPAPGETLPQWTRKEILADKIMKGATDLHQESNFREALAEYLRALKTFSDASVDADAEGQARLTAKWVQAENSARTLSNAMGNKNFNPGRRPSTVVLKKAGEAPPPDMPAAPASRPGGPPDDSGYGGGGGGGGMPSAPRGGGGGMPSAPSAASGPSKDEDSMDALMARLKNLRS